MFAVYPDCGNDLTPTREGCVPIEQGNNDPAYVHDVANLLADGHPYVDPTIFRLTGEETPTAHKMPLFPALLAVPSLVGADGAQAHRVMGVLLGVAAVVAIGLVGRQLAGGRAGLVAAAVAAVYPHLWINDHLLHVESLYACLIAASMGLAYRFWHSPTLGRGAALGAVLGLTTMTRAEAVLLFAFLVLPLVLFARLAWREALKLLVMIGVVGGLVMAPWIGWNLVRFNDPTYFSIAPGTVLITATCDETYYGEGIGYAGNCFDYQAAAAEAGVPPELMGKYLFALDESERATLAGDQANAYIRDHLRRLPVVMLARVGRTWDVYKPRQNVRLNWQIEGRGRRASQAGLLAWYVLLPLSVGGLVVLRRRGVPITPFLAVAAMITITAAWTFGTARYRVAVDVVVIIAAAVLVDAVLRRWWAVPEGTGLDRRETSDA